MAFDPNLLTRNRVFGAKIEVTTGLAVSLANTDCGIFSAVLDPKITPDIKPNERQGQQYLSKLLSIPGARAGKATFRTEFFSTGGAPAWASLLMPACGVGMSGGVGTPFTPTPANPINTISIGLFQAGRLKLIAGCAGDFVIRAQAGSPIYFEWTFEGVWQSPSTTAIPGGITYPTQIPPRFAGVTVTVGGQSMRFPNFEFHSGNKVYLRQDQSAVDQASPTPVGTGYRGGIVTDRMPLIRMAPEAYLLSTLDFFAAHSAQTTYNFAFSAGAAGNQLQFSAPKAQLNNPPQDEDREGVMADALEFLCSRTSGDDDYTLTWA